ncbi:hypothetical protein SDC9_206254 [bioreactor metagenome]|uniref:HTH cro/C1-type domain-containing protein n=1 Tax=bioreactor metagenome TaxID=1076179 RepID=A0A645J4I2_9ZZZZ
MNGFRRFREKTGLKQVQVAAVMRTHQSAVSYWESGDSLPRPDKLPALAALYHCTIDELLRDYPDNSSITRGEAI